MQDIRDQLLAGWCFHDGFLEGLGSDLVVTCPDPPGGGRVLLQGRADAFCPAVVVLDLLLGRRVQFGQDIVQCLEGRCPNLDRSGDLLA